MDKTLEKKKLLTLLLFLCTTSVFDGMIINSLTTYQGHFWQNHIKFVMTLAINGQNHFYLTLFTLYRQYYNKLLFVLVSILHLHRYLQGIPLGQGSLLSFY